MFYKTSRDKEEKMTDHDETITWEQWEHLLSAVHGYARLVDELDDKDLSDRLYPSHIEDVNSFSDDPASINNNSVNPAPPAPELSVSETPSPSDDLSYDLWKDADDMPTRPPSALFLQEFPPLVRCREDPAMGRPEDITVLEIEDDSVPQHWLLWNTSSGRETTTTEEIIGSSSFSSKGVHECKDDEGWSIIYSEDSPSMLHTERESRL